MLKEFREFALRGNLIDLAIGFIIGAAFSGLVQSLVNDIIMPIVGRITGGVDFSNHYVQLAGASPARQLRRGAQGRGDARLRQLPHAGDQLPDHRLGAVPGGEGDQSIEAPAAARRGGAGAATAAGIATRGDPGPARESAAPEPTSRLHFFAGSPRPDRGVGNLWPGSLLLLRAGKARLVAEAEWIPAGACPG